MKKIMITVVASLITLSVNAELKVDVKSLDTDQDGLISLEEAQKVPELAEKFASLDVNKDGYLSKEEFNPTAKK